MEITGVEAILRALNENQVCYLIAGGLAVVAHGYVRFTADVDLMIATDDQNIARLLTAIKPLGYVPRAPIAIEQLADASARAQWVSEKQLVVFSLHSARFPRTEVDIFLDPPIDVEAAMRRAVSIEITPGITANVCSLDDLVEMKKIAGRPNDLDDIAQLRAIHPGRIQ